MPIEYRIDAEAGVELTCFRGAVDDQQVLDYLRTLVDDPKHSPDLHTLVDLRGVEEIRVTSAGVRRLAELAEALGERLRRSRVAILASEDAPYGIGRMYQLLRDGAAYEIAVFRNEAEARRWLGLPGA